MKGRACGPVQHIRQPALSKHSFSFLSELDLSSTVSYDERLGQYALPSL